MLVNEEKLNMKKKLLKPYLIDGGFYGNDNKWNALVSFPFDPNVYRDRVETIIIRDQKEVFVKNMLFATLDITTRAIVLKNKGVITLTEIN